MRRPKAGSVVLLLATAAIVVWPLVSLADPPGWIVDGNAFKHDGAIIACVELGAGAVPDIADTLGAFVDGECRGAIGGWETPVGDIIFLLTVHSNEVSGENLLFLYYDASDDMVKGVEETIEFVADMVIGSLLHPEPLTPAERESWTAIKALFR